MVEFCIHLFDDVGSLVLVGSPMEHAACVEHLIEVGHLLQNHTNTLVECARSQIRCYFSTESLILYMYS